MLALSLVQGGSRLVDQYGFIDSLIALDSLDLILNLIRNNLLVLSIVSMNGHVMGTVVADIRCLSGIHLNRFIQSMSGVSAYVVGKVSSHVPRHIVAYICMSLG